MPFIGQEPLQGSFHKLDAITTSATATYNLLLNGGAFTPGSANQLLVSLNGVIQSPGSSFTISGSQIIFSSALTSSDSIDFIMSYGDVLNAGVPSDGTVNTSQLANDAVHSAKLADANVTQAKLAAGVAGNGPSFSAYLNASFTISSATHTKLQFETEEWDTASCYDTSTYRFTPNVAGYYMIGGHFQPQASYTTGTTQVYKNGSAYRVLHWNQHASSVASPAPVGGQTLVYMNGTNDYVELYGFMATAKIVEGASDWSLSQGHMVETPE